MLAIYSCGEEEETTVTPIFIEKPVFIESNELATAKVLDFLNHTDVGEITLRSDFSDTEVNEGLWTLEAASNYVDNVNISKKSETTVEYTLTIANVVDDEIIKMSGVDMVAKFNQLQADISAEESTNGKTAKIVDFKLDAVSAQQSDLTIGVVYAGLLNVDGCEDWPASQYILLGADETLKDCLVAAIAAQNSNYVWYQTVSIIWPSSCLFGGYVYTTEDGYMTPTKFDEAYDNALEVVACLHEETFPDDGTTNYGGGSPTWIDINLLGDKTFCCDTGLIHCTEVVFGYGIAY